MNAFITEKVKDVIRKKKRDRKQDITTFKQFCDVTLSDSEDGKDPGNEESDNEDKNQFSKSEEESDNDSN